jgi:hypothetical protein
MNRRVKGRGKIRQMTNHLTIPLNSPQESAQSLGVLRRRSFQNNFDLVVVAKRVLVLLMKN